MNHYIVCDLEATCFPKNSFGQPKTSEIIEIGAVWCDKEFNILSEFDEFVKPTVHKTLSDYCTNLTTIKQSDVDTALKFPEVLNNFITWMEQCTIHFAAHGIFCSWGDYDRKQFIKDCAFHNVPYPFDIQHINLKGMYGKLMNCKPCGMKEAMNQCNLDLAGCHHRGIDDSRNIAKICKYIINKDK